MTEAYRAAELASAKAEHIKAMAAWKEARAKGKRGNREAEEVEFWGNKVAFLACAK